jgi:hypothetical protein
MTEWLEHHVVAICSSNSTAWFMKYRRRRPEGGWMGANQNSSSELGLYPKSDLTHLSSNVFAYSHQFCGATDKPNPAWFWGTNQETVAVILRPKSPNRSYRFWGPNWDTLHHLGFKAQPRNHRHRFWGQTGKTVTTGFEAKLEKTVDMYFSCNSRTHVITLYSSHACDVLCVNASVLTTHIDHDYD